MYAIWWHGDGVGVGGVVGGGGGGVMLLFWEETIFHRFESHLGMYAMRNHANFIAA